MQLLKRYLILPHRCRILLILSLLLASSTTICAAQQQKTLFLPLKVTSLSKGMTPAEADNALRAALVGEEFTFLEREKAESLLDYDSEWPPATRALEAVESFRAYGNLVVGSITEIAGNISLSARLVDLLSPEDSKYFSFQGGRKQLDSLFSDLVRQIAESTSTEDVVVSIAPHGNKKIDSGAILRNISTEPGDPYNPAALREDLKSIYRMGYFDDVQIEVRQQPEGKTVIFRIDEKPVVRSIEFDGIEELKEENVREVVTIKEQSILNPAQLRQDSDAIQLLYKSKGFYNTQVSPEVEPAARDTVEVRFVIDEGSKIYIRDISFEGNTTFDDDELEDQMETSTKGWFSWITDSGLLDYDKLNQDAGRILNFYGNHGFLEAKISDPIVKQEGEWLYITFSVEEGTRFRVGEVDVEGDLLTEPEVLEAMFDVSNEEFVSRKILREDIRKITDYYAERGYANANIRPQIDPGEKEDVLDITINIDKGELVYINRITITGNDRTRDNVIRRELEVKEGGIFNAKALRDSLQNLQYLDFFEDVNIRPETSFDASTVDLSVEVEEKSTGQFTIGAGYSSVDDLILMGQIAENNFLGRGDTLALSANIGGDSNRYNLQYKNPRLYDSQLSWGIDLFDMEREYDDYTKDSTGGALSFGYPIWEKWRGYGSYSYSDTTLTDIDDNASYIIRNSAGINITSAVKFTLQRDSRNRRFGASRGSRHSVSLRYAGGPLSGDSQFTKIEGYTSWYFPLFMDTVFHLHGAAGQVFENEDDALPVYERFYLGGLRSIRGFDYAKVSPIDPQTGDRIGGDKMWFTNFEFIFPLLTEQGITGVLFYDMGNVLNDDEDWGFDNYKKSVGAGIRWFSPMGPLRLEWGYNLDPEPDEDDSVWDFSIGGVF